MTATQHDKRFSGFGDGIGGFEGAADAEFSVRRERATRKRNTERNPGEWQQ
ncbi:MAG: hypothetical protein ACTHNO_04900 [Ralstonia sp.]|uniref:hypothetical protein n=1 Tax=Ralstonia sp. TaxID=54061 RepID=UPI003F7D4967